jgi:hypothetical protein
MSGIVELDHVIYSLVPYKGYGVRAWSRKEAAYDAERAFKGWFSPYDQLTVRPGVELRAIAMGFKDYMYIARVFLREGLDELRRSGVVSHIALVPLDIALEKRLSLEEVDKAMASYVASKGIGMNEIEPLRLSFSEKDRDEDLEYLKTVVDVDEAGQLLEYISEPDIKTIPDIKIIVIFEGDIESRARLAYALAKMFAIHGVAEYIVTLEKPIDNILIEFTRSVIVLDKMIPGIKPTRNWRVVKIARERKGRSVKTDIDTTLKKLGYI